MMHNVPGDQASVITLSASHNEMLRTFDKDDNDDLLEPTSVRLALLSVQTSVYNTHKNK